MAFSAAFSGGVPIEAGAHELFLGPLMAFWEILGGRQGHICTDDPTHVQYLMEFLFTACGFQPGVYGTKSTLAGSSGCDYEPSRVLVTALHPYSVVFL